ncbi:MULTISPECIES: metal-binding protein [Metallosphaera]|nr:MULTISPECIES: metal-binding protein [Metallosphaera]MCY0862586.1 metal-binding protein [Metallosphaera prunae]QCO30227.1 metal-binding protein [Metallosphaera prunae]WPX06236.1 metal-binding protein [Metallosphaera sedula DSM 5348]BBL48484.1 hypothetical protein MJ1HA_2617 [Metallosphaera sedula]
MEIAKEESKYSREAEKAVKEGRVIELRTREGGPPLFVFMAREKGSHRDHIVGPTSCDCEYFLFHGILEGEGSCIHIQAYNIASRNESFRKIVVKREELKEILTEIFAYGKSLKLRKLISSR